MDLFYIQDKIGTWHLIEEQDKGLIFWGKYTDFGGLRKDLERFRKQFPTENLNLIYGDSGVKRRIQKYFDRFGQAL